MTFKKIESFSFSSWHFMRFKCILRPMQINPRSKILRKLLVLFQTSRLNAPILFIFESLESRQTNAILLSVNKRSVKTTHEDLPHKVSSKPCSRSITFGITLANNVYSGCTSFKKVLLKLLNKFSISKTVFCYQSYQPEQKQILADIHRIENQHSHV